jgi:hypothetical protein
LALVAQVATTSALILALVAHHLLLQQSLPQVAVVVVTRVDREQVVAQAAVAVTLLIQQ